MRFATERKKKPKPEFQLFPFLWKARVKISRVGCSEVNIYILLTKREGRTGRISARGLDSTDRAQRGPYKKDRGPIFSQYGPEQAWLIRDLLHD